MRRFHAGGGRPDTWNATSPGADTGPHVSVAGFGNGVGVAGSYVKLLSCCAARFGSAAAKTAAQKLLDGMWADNQDAPGISAPETCTDHSRSEDPVPVPGGWTGTMPNGGAVNGGSTFMPVRSRGRSDPSFAKVRSDLTCGAAPAFSCHRFWPQADIGTATAAYGELSGG